MTIYAWGANIQESLRLETPSDSILSPQPSLLSDVSGASNPLAIAGGSVQGCCLRQDGTALIWKGPFQQSPSPVETVVTLTHIPVLQPVVQVTCGLRFSLVLTEGGRLYGWGSNRFGQLGNQPMKKVEEPVEVPTPSEVVSVACGENHVIALTKDKRVLVWGNNRHSQIPRSTETNGSIVSWGRNDYGQLGRGHESAHPKKVDLPGRVSKLSTGSEHVIALMVRLRLPKGVQTPAGEREGARSEGDLRAAMGASVGKRCAGCQAVDSKNP
ncbi:unnamed protein product [Cyprideis torosa]|uniref:Uncharacterized protein n=1 Tax=Cyprideis torosa TaxID=163714 RepID=A0A7R8ZJF6_9CRUS|nr:unnamed protein product [Cyprideis torosa]CAG0888520.1 unnamed protein product [Cyprideis torosa]